MKKIITALTSLGERQGAVTKKAAEYLQSELRNNKIPFVVETVSTFLPVGSAVLTADNIPVTCAPTSFVGGPITSKDSIVSSLIPTKYLIDVPNINFNPKSTALSLPNFYFAPSVAIRREDVERIISATEVRGEVVIEKTAFELPQILVGNRVNPKTIVFSHFDSVGPGAIDNASGTAVCLSIAIENPQLLTNTLFVFDPNEELSYDKPTYWGHGYRSFEERYLKQLDGANTIIVVDCVGNGATRVISDPRILNLAFPIANLSRMLTKTVTIGGDIEKMMEVYQSDADLEDEVMEEFLAEAREVVVDLITRP